MPRRVLASGLALFGLVLLATWLNRASRQGLVSIATLLGILLVILLLDYVGNNRRGAHILETGWKVFRASVCFLAAFVLGFAALMGAIKAPGSMQNFLFETILVLGACALVYFGVHGKRDP